MEYDKQRTSRVGRKTLAFVNFELPAFEFADYTSVYSAPEMYSMIDFYVNQYPLSPDPSGLL